MKYQKLGRTPPMSKVVIHDAEGRCYDTEHFEEYEMPESIFNYITAKVVSWDERIDVKWQVDFETNVCEEQSDELITLYRGMEPDHFERTKGDLLMHQSWTIDRRIATFFATRNGSVDGVLLTMKVRPLAIDWFVDSSEREAIVDTEFAECEIEEAIEEAVMVSKDDHKRIYWDKKWCKRKRNIHPSGYWQTIWGQAYWPQINQENHLWNWT
ncbi:MAG: hypothetical protein ACRC42_01710 [Mycoplasma sp.]